jgi:hypothetical protein
MSIDRFLGYDIHDEEGTADLKSYYILEKDHFAEITKLKTQREDLAESLQSLLDFTDEPPDKNCSCHINPLCGDCVCYSEIREVIKIARQALLKAKGES